MKTSKAFREFPPNHGHGKRLPNTLKAQVFTGTKLSLPKGGLQSGAMIFPNTWEWLTIYFLGGIRVFCLENRGEKWLL